MRRRVFAAGVSILLAAGCSVVLGLDPPTYDGPIATPEAGVSDAPAEASPPSNPAGKLDDPSRWSTYKPEGAGYQASAFDGRFIYFVRATDVDGVDAGLTGSRILRYDTTTTRFDDPAAWTTFDPETSLGTSGPHLAAVMEGKYLVIGAYSDHLFLRFDTTKPPADFTLSSQWETFDAKELAPVARAYNAAMAIPGGAMFMNGSALTPAIHQGEAFDAGWQVTEYDGGTFACPSVGNAVCKGSNVFFVPSGSSTIACLARYDTTKTLQTGFDSIDVASFGEGHTFIAGGIATPQHLYLTQYNTGDAAVPVSVLRRPIDGPLDAGWEKQPTNVKNPLTRGFHGGAFDGRYLYLAPYPVPTTTTIFSRFDTTLGFDDPNGWDIAAATALAVPAARFWGAAFDGQYVYYVPYTALGNETPMFARFKAYDTKIAVPPICR